MKINYKILSIPPYISTSWHHVTSLHLEKRDDETLLVVGLSNGVCIEVPLLEQPIIDAIFAIHAKVIEQSGSSHPLFLGPQTNTHPNGGVEKKESIFTFGFPLPVSMEHFEQLGTFLQHSSQQSNAPDLPQEVLQKVGSLIRTIGVDNASVLPSPEPHCNCPHCQIARALHAGLESDGSNPEHIGIKKESADLGETAQKEEEVLPGELIFRDKWEINLIGDQIYKVTNPKDEKEYYNVFLGAASGCTCGKPNCEHVHAVRNQ